MAHIQDNDRHLNGGPSAPDKQFYLIIGAGVFGISTAYHLIQKHPHASITLIDRDAYDAEVRNAASWDWNKVVRADYDDLLYCRLALEAQDVFRSDPLWRPFFRETGTFWICRDEYAGAVVANHEKLGRRANIAAFTVPDAKDLYDGLFENADFRNATNVLVNRNSGAGAAADCLRAVTQRAVDLGVKYVTADVGAVLVDRSRRRCVGVRTVGGQVYKAATVLVCTGAFTPKLLELSAAESDLPDLAVGGRIVAGGIATGLTTLDKKSQARFASMPVAMQRYTAAQGPFIGSLPPTKDGELKWWGHFIFQNTQEVLPGRFISAPPPERDYAQWRVPRRLKEDIDRARDIFFGREDVVGWKKMEKHRICWDAFTTSSDFIISPHAAASGLFVATCGSFHGWKFFPVLGKYIVQMLEGSLPDELRDRWAWDRPRPDPKLNSEWPRWEMRDFLDPEEEMVEEQTNSRKLSSKI